METDSSPTMDSFVWERPPLGRRAVFQNPLSSGVEITTGKGAKERGSSFLLGFPFRDLGGVTDIDGEEGSDVGVQYLKMFRIFVFLASSLLQSTHGDLFGSPVDSRSPASLP